MPEPSMQIQLPTVTMPGHLIQLARNGFFTVLGKTAGHVHATHAWLSADCHHACLPAHHA